jgi:hypothetical protein
MSTDSFGCCEVGSEDCYWHLVGKGQRCCYTSYNAQDSPVTKQQPAQKADSAKSEKPWTTAPAFCLVFPWLP